MTTKTKQLGIRFPLEWVEEMELMIKQKLHHDYSDLIKLAVREYLDKHQDTVNKPSVEDRLTALERKIIEIEDKL